MILTYAQEISIGGFFSNGYIKSSTYNYLVDSSDGDYSFVEAGLNASWTPRDRLTVNGQLFAYELGKYGNFEPLIDYLFIDYNVRREFGIRVGRVKRDIGIYSNIQDIDAARTSILLPMGMYDQRYREFSAFIDGFSLYGNLNIGENQSIDYVAYAGVLDLQPEGGLAGYALTELSRTAVNPSVETVDSKYSTGLQLWYHPKLDGLRLGVAATQLQDISLHTSGTLPSFFPNPFLAGQEVMSMTDNIDFTFLRGAVEYYIEDWSFLGEYVRTIHSYDITSTVAGIPFQSGSQKVNSDSWYVSLARRIGQWEAALTYTKLQNAQSNPNSDFGQNPSASYNKDIQFSIRYDVSDNWTLKIESHSIKGTNRLFNQFGQNPVTEEESWTLYAAKSTFYF